LINGQRYFPRGSNYIASQWLSEVISPQVARSARHPFPPPGSTTAMADMPWFERDVSLAKQANLNLLRVHAHVLPPEFHDACDRAGILVWQDFALQWGYADDPGFHAEAVRQLGAMIHSLFNHPSIIAWCCHNESPWDAPWMADESGGVYDPAQNRKLDERLATVAQELDPTRYVHLNSGTGDGHVYPGWYFGRWQDYARLPAAPFPTEYGAQGLPQHTSLLQTFIQLGSDAGYADLVKFKEWLDQQPRYREKRRLLPEKSVPEELRQAYHTWRTWCFHDFQPLETFRRGRVTLGDNLDEFIASSQIYQAWILQYATETYRRHKHQPISGVIQFMFTDPWPAITWSVLDYWRLPKPAYEILRQVMQPILPCTDMLPASRANRAHFIRLFAINDKLRDYPEARLEYTVEEIGRNTVATGVLSLNLVADAVVAVGRVRLPALAPGTYRLQLSLFSAQSELLGKNEYSFIAKER
jgi:beta-mannosidase